MVPGLCLPGRALLDVQQHGVSGAAHPQLRRLHLWQRHSSAAMPSGVRSGNCIAMWLAGAQQHCGAPRCAFWQATGQTPLASSKTLWLHIDGCLGCWEAFTVHGTRLACESIS